MEETSKSTALRSFLPALLIGLLVFAAIAGGLRLIPQDQQLEGVVYPLDGQQFTSSTLSLFANQQLNPSLLLEVMEKNGELDWSEAVNERSLGSGGYLYSVTAEFQDGDRVHLPHQRYNSLLKELENQDYEPLASSMSWSYADEASGIDRVFQTDQSELSQPEFQLDLVQGEEQDQELIMLSIGLNITEDIGNSERFNRAKSCEYYDLNSEWLDWSNVRHISAPLYKKGDGNYLIQPGSSWNRSNTCYFMSLMGNADSLRTVFASPELEAKAQVNLQELYVPDQDFASLLSIDFETPFYDSQKQRETDELIAYRAAQKKRLAGLLKTTPSVSIDPDKIVLYPNRAIVSLDLKPNRQYQVDLSQGTDVYGSAFETQQLQVETGELKYLGIRQQESQSIFMLQNPPTLELLHANVDNPTVKICRVDIESYAKVEQMSSRRADYDFSQEFFLAGIDEILGSDCDEKEIELADEGFKTALNIDQWQEGQMKPGLYVATFAFQSERQILPEAPAFAPLFFSLVDSHITMKFSKNGKSLFWVNDLESGNGVEGVQLSAMKNIFKASESEWDNTSRQMNYSYYSPLDTSIYGEKISLGTTDDDGFLEVDLSQSDYYDAFASWYDDAEHRSLLVVAEGNEHMSYVVSKWNSGIADWNFGFSPASWDDSGEYSAHIYPDRKLYLPGETVHLKAVIRQESDQIRIPTGKTFQLTVRDSNYETILEEDLPINQYGSFVRDIEIDADAPLGTYRVDLRGDNGEIIEYIKGTEFNVEEFQKPSFKVEVAVSSTGLENDVLINPKVSETKTRWGYRYKTFNKSLSLKAKVMASYYQGGLVKNAPVSYSVFKQYYYENSYWDDCYYGCFYEPYKDFVSEGSGQLDDQGQLTLDIPVDHETSWSDYRYLVEVSVTDETAQKVTGTGSVIAKVPAEMRQYNPYSKLEWEVDRQFVPQGEQVEITLKPERKWNASYEDRYRFILERRTYSTKHQENAAGDLTPILDYEDEELEDIEIGLSKFTLKEDGTLSYQITLPEDGEYLLSMVEGRGDSEELMNTRKLYAYAPNGITNAPVVADNKIAVLTEKVSYHLGETAQLFVRLPFSEGKALITIERKNVISKELVDIKGNTLIKQYTVDNTFLPNAYISVVAFKPATGTKLQPEYKVGYAEVVVDKTDKKLFTTVKTDKATYAPRDEVRIDISTKDKNNEPVASEVSVAVVDEALIAMMGNIDMDILPKFFRKVIFQTHTALTNVAMLKHLYFARKGIIGGSGAKDGGDSITTRSDFKNTAYYLGQLTTRADGKASTSFTLPDNIGEFRIIVIGHSKSHFFGAGEASLAVRQDIVIEETMPLIARRGDDMRVGATVFNNSSEEKEIAVALDTEGLISPDDTRKTVKIPAQSQEFVTWSVRVADSKAASITYTLSAVDQSNKKGDRIEKLVELADTPLLAQRQHWTKELITTGSKSFELLKDLDPERTEVTLAMSQSMLVGVEKIMNSLLVYPYGCIEQTISSTLPNAIVKRFKDLLPLEITSEAIDKNLQAGIKRFQSMQVEDGGFAYWEGSRESEPHITPYVVSSLVQMRDLGVTIPEEMIQKAQVYLEKQVSSLEGVLVDDRLSQLVHEAHALAKLGSTQFDTARVLLQNRQEKLSSHERIIFALALAKNDLGAHRTRIAQLIKTIDISASEGNPRNYYWDSTADKALFSQLLIMVDPEHEDLESLIKDLYSIDWGSYYYSTQAKIQSFIAFAEYLQKVEQPSQGRVNLKYVMGDKTGRIILNSGAIQKRTFRLSQLGTGLDSLSTELEVLDAVEKPIYVDMVIKQIPNKPQDIPAQQDKGMTVNRQYFRLGKVVEVSQKWWNENQQDLAPVSGNTLTLGETYLVKIHVGTDAARQQVALESYLPSGLKLVNPRFLTEATAVGHDRGYNWPFYHQELRSDRFFASAGRLDTKNWGDSSEHEITYVVRAIVPGTFMEPPVSVYPMYQPEVEAHTAFRELVIKE